MFFIYVYKVVFSLFVGANVGPLAKSLAHHTTGPVFLAVHLCSFLAADLTDMACRKGQGFFQLGP